MTGDSSLPFAREPDQGPEPTDPRPSQTPDPQGIRDAGLDDVLRLPLALRRLDLLVPAGLILSDAWPMLEAFGAGKLDLREEAGYLRLFESGVAESLYDTLGGRTPEARAHDLVVAWRWALERDPSTAVRLLHTLAQGHPGLSSVATTHVAREAAEAWVDRDPRSIPALLQPEIWCAWAIWAAREPAVSEVLGPDPLARTLDALGPAHKAWATIWLRLWLVFEGHPALVDAAAAWTTLPETFEHQSWSRVWECRLRGLDVRTPAFREVFALGQRWLAGREHRLDWNYVWQLLLRFASVGELENALLAQGRAWLEGREDRRDWAFVWEALAERLPSRGAARGELLARGWQWLQRREERPEWAYLWRALVELRADLPADLPAATVLEGGKAWLDGRLVRPEWPHVWGDLVASPNELPPTLPLADLLRIGVRWTQANAGAEEWIPVWRRIMELRASHPPDLPVGELLDQGLAWLPGHEDHPTWTQVWRKLTKRPGDLPPDVATRLVQHGVAWMQGRDLHVGWTYVWVRLCGVAEECPPLVSLEELWVRGLAWLEAPTPRPNRYLVLNRLVELAQTHPQQLDLRQPLGLAWTWLERNDEHPKWAGIMAVVLRRRALLSDVPTASLQSRVAHWLEARGHLPVPEGELLPELFVEALGAGDCAASVLDAARAWAEAHPDRPGARIVAFKLLCLRVGDPALDVLAFLAADWLRTTLPARLRGPALTEQLTDLLDARAPQTNGWRQLHATLRTLPRAPARVETPGTRFSGRITSLDAKHQLHVDIGWSAVVRHLSPDHDWRGLVGLDDEFTIVAAATKHRDTVLSSKRVEEVRHAALASLQPGAIVEGLVVSHTLYGAFVASGPITALLHVSAVPGGAEALTTLYPVGERRRLRVMRVDAERGQIAVGAVEE